MTVRQSQEQGFARVIGTLRRDTHLWASAATTAVSASATFVVRAITNAARSEVSTAAPASADASQNVPTVPVYTRMTIQDPLKHMEELAAAKQPYANVHFDEIE